MHVDTVYNQFGPKPIVTGSIFSKSLKILADTGSQISIIPKKYLPSTMLNNLKPSSVMLQAYNGTPIPTLGVVMGDISLGTPVMTTLHACNLYVVDNDSTPVIGSCDLLRFGFYGIDPDRSRMFINGNFVNIELCGGNQTTVTKVNVVQPTLKPSCQSEYSLVVHKNVTVPSRSEMVISIPAPTNVEGLYINHACKLNNNIIIGGAVNYVSNGSKVHIPVVNHSEMDRVIRRGTVLCNMTETCDQNIHQSGTPVSINSISNTCMDTRIRAILSEFKVNSSAPTVIKSRFESIVRKFNHVFAVHGEELGLTNTALFEVNTGDHHPVASQPYKVPFGLRKEMDTIINKHLREGIMEEVNSPWSAPCLLVRKSDGSHRLVCDYRRLNDATEFDCYPLPCIRDSLVSLAKSKVYTCMDLMSGFHQIPCSEDAKKKLAISTYQGKQYTWSRMPMGPKNGPPTFQRLMDTISRGIGPDRLIVYLDDILVHGVNYDEMLNSLETTLQRLSDNGLRIKATKVYALQTKIEFAGYSISDGVLKPLQSRVEDITCMLPPVDSKGAQRVFGMFNFHRAFVKNFAQIAAPITKTYSNLKGRKFFWTSDAQMAMEKLKLLIADASLKLYLPEMENTHLVLETDASDRGIGGVLYFCSKNDSNHNHDHACLRPIEYYSKMLTQGKENMFIREKELFAFLYATQKYRMYLLGKQFTWRTDNSSISWARKVSPNKAKLARWLSEIEPFMYKVQLVKSKNMPISDALSRSCMVNLVSVQSADRKATLIKNYHDSGHSSISVTLADLKKLYKWPNMESEVREFIKCCDHCQKMKPNLRPQRVPKQPTDTPNGPYKKIAIDLTGPFITTDRHNRYIMVVVDHFSKRVHACPIKSKSGVEIVWELRKIIFSMPELPSILVSDNGLEFNNQHMHELLEHYKIKHVRTSPYYPQSNGLVERTNCTIKTKVNTKVANWDVKLPEVIHCINRAEHNVTKTSPFEIETDHPGLNPSDPERITFERPNPMHEKIKQRMEQEKQDRTKPGGSVKPFAVGSLVLQKNAVCIGGGEKTRFVGPYKVIKVFDGGTSYKIEDIENGVSYRRSMYHLKQYFPSKVVDSSSGEPESTVDSSENIFDDHFTTCMEGPSKQLADLDHLSYAELQSLGRTIGCPDVNGSHSRVQRSLSVYLDQNRDKCEPLGVIYLRKPCMGSSLMENSYGIPMEKMGEIREVALKNPTVEPQDRQTM